MYPFITSSTGLQEQALRVTIVISLDGTNFHVHYEKNNKSGTMSCNTYKRWTLKEFLNMKVRIIATGRKHKKISLWARVGKVKFEMCILQKTANVIIDG